MRFGKGLEGKDILLFLDVDGVLNTSDSFHTKYELHDESIKILAELMGKLTRKRGKPKVILTSTWRLGYDPDFKKCSPQIQKLILRLGEYGIPIYDRTPIYKGITRDMEILRYIRGYALKEEDFAFVTLDDDGSVYGKDAMREIHYYGVNHKTGLIGADIRKIMRRIKEKGHF